MPRHQLLALTKSVAGREVEFEHWYDTQHIPDVLRVPGVVSAKRFRIEKVMTAAESPGWISLAIYEIESDDPETVLAGIRGRARTPEMPLTDAMDPSATWQILTASAPSDSH